MKPVIQTSQFKKDIKRLKKRTREASYGGGNTLIPEPKSTSPFDVKGVSTDIKTSEIVATIREERGRSKR